MTQHTPTEEHDLLDDQLKADENQYENPMAKALADHNYLQSGAMAADEIERLETQLARLRQDKAELTIALNNAVADVKRFYEALKVIVHYLGVVPSDSLSSRGKALYTAQAAIKSTQ